MKQFTSVLLPGLDGQIKFLQNSIDLADKNILVLGSGSGMIPSILAEKVNKVCVIEEDYDSLLNTKFELGSGTNVDVKMMEFERTDFKNDEFDLIYAQASISNFGRNKIIKELKRVSSPDACMCIGEIVKLTAEIPGFVRDIFMHSNLNPLYKEDLLQYYRQRNFGIAAKIDLSHTLKRYYEENLKQFKILSSKMDKSEKSYYKKILKRLSHESNVYLKLGGDKHIGYISLLLTKDRNIS